MPDARRGLGPHGLKTYLFAAAVGVLGGLLGSAFQVAGLAVQRAIVGQGDLLQAAKNLAWWEALLIPFAGAVVAALLTYWLTRHRASQGMEDVMEAVTLKRAKQLSVRRTIARALSSFAIIATGGSLGREGPIAYMAASFGARFARAMRVPLQRLGIFAGCGIAAGMAASYFAPFGAALFAMEVVLKNFAMEIFAPVMVASVVASLVVQGLADGVFSGFMSGAPVYKLPGFEESRPAEYLIYLTLGCLAACGGWLFIRTRRECRRLFDRLPASPLVRIPLGGLAVGAIGIWLPEVWGNGYHAVNLVLTETPVLGFVALLFVMKILATSINLGSGASGGVFTPTLFVGVALGLLVGSAAQALFPSLVTDPRSYAVVGMAAAVASTTAAPITAIFLLFEMTREPGIVLPLMVAAISASLTARALGMESIYTSPLRRRGVHIPEGIEETALTTTHVRDVMREDAVWIRQTATFDMIVGMVQKTRRDSIYVVDADLHLVGMIRLHDIKNFLADEELGPAVIAADLTVAVPHATPDQTLAEVMGAFDDPEVHELPVIDPEARNLVAVVERRDLLTHFSVEVLQSQQMRAKFVEHEGAQHYVQMERGHALARVAVPKDMVGKTLASSDFRNRTGVTVLSIVHSDNGRETRIQPEPGTVLHEKDALIVIGPKDKIKSLGGQV